MGFQVSMPGFRWTGPAHFGRPYLDTHAQPNPSAGAVLECRKGPRSSYLGAHRHKTGSQMLVRSPGVGSVDAAGQINPLSCHSFDGQWARHTGQPCTHHWIGGAPQQRYLQGGRHRCTHCKRGRGERLAADLEHSSAGGLSQEVPTRAQATRICVPSLSMASRITPSCSTLCTTGTGFLQTDDCGTRLDQTHVGCSAPRLKSEARQMPRRDLAVTHQLANVVRDPQ